MISFSKYSSTGNDFVVVDNRDGSQDTADIDFWQRVCDRHFGVGADGVLFLESSNKFDYRMRYLNADGGEVAMCGNGARALCHYYRSLCPGAEAVSFETAGGVYDGEVLADGRVSILMSELYDEGAIGIKDLYSEASHCLYLNTGVPHCVYEVRNADTVDLMKVAPAIRHEARFEKGVNVNFYHVTRERELTVRTFERGVEGETLSCGTGIVATAIAYARAHNLSDGSFKIKARGGELSVRFEGDQVFYEGEVLVAFRGEILL